MIKNVKAVYCLAIIINKNVFIICCAEKKHTVMYRRQFCGFTVKAIASHHSAQFAVHCMSSVGYLIPKPVHTTGVNDNNLINSLSLTHTHAQLCLCIHKYRQIF